MLKLRKLIPILASISLAGCITYSGDGYYSSPGITEYNSDEYYGNYDNYNGNYGQYEYYGNQPSVVFNFNIGYGYGSGYGYGYGYPSFYFPIYAYYPNYYGWGYWPVYDYHAHHHHHNKKPPRDQHNPPNDNDDHDDQDNNDSVVIGDDYPNNNGTRPNKRPGKLGQFPNQRRTPGIYNGNTGALNTRPNPAQPLPVRRPNVIDSLVVVDDNDTIRPPKNYSQQPKPLRPAPVRQRNPIQIDDDGEIVADQYVVRTYNAQQPNSRNRANPTQPNPVQNSRRPQNADRNSYAQPLHAEVEQPPTGNNNGPAPQPQPRQPKQGNTQKSESREQKHAKEEGDD
jgi:hypothetical protein